jgi:hypothetical protein
VRPNDYLALGMALAIPVIFVGAHLWLGVLDRRAREANRRASEQKAAP